MVAQRRGKRINAICFYFGACGLKAATLYGAATVGTPPWRTGFRGCDMGGFTKNTLGFTFEIVPKKSARDIIFGSLMSHLKAAGYGGPAEKVYVSYRDPLVWETQSDNQ